MALIAVYSNEKHYVTCLGELQIRFIVITRLMLCYCMEAWSDASVFFVHELFQFRSCQTTWYKTLANPRLPHCRNYNTHYFRIKSLKSLYFLEITTQIVFTHKCWDKLKCILVFSFLTSYKLLFPESSVASQYTSVSAFASVTKPLSNSPMIPAGFSSTGMSPLPHPWQTHSVFEGQCFFLGLHFVMPVLRSPNNFLLHVSTSPENFNFTMCGTSLLALSLCLHRSPSCRSYK